jgi:hypothetical protein
MDIMYDTLKPFSYFVENKRLLIYNIIYFTQHRNNQLLIFINNKVKEQKNSLIKRKETITNIFLYNISRVVLEVTILLKQLRIAPYSTYLLNTDHKPRVDTLIDIIFRSHLIKSILTRISPQIMGIRI